MIDKISILLQPWKKSIIYPQQIFLDIWYPEQCTKRMES